MKQKSLTIALIVVGICTLGVVSAAAQISISSLFSVNYFANNGVSGAPDATVRVTNPGTSNGNLCAMVYVFDNDQQMTECCGCITTPDGLRTFSVNKDLTSNPLTGVISNERRYQAPRLARQRLAVQSGPHRSRWRNGTGGVELSGRRGPPILRTKSGVPIRSPRRPSATPG